MLASERNPEIEKRLSHSYSPSLRQITRHLTIQIKSIENLTLPEAVTNPNISLSIKVELIFAGKTLLNPLSTKSIPTKYKPGPSEQQDPVVFNAFLTFDLPLCNVPRSSHLGITVFANWDNNSRPVAWANFLLINFKNEMATGPSVIRLWNGGPANPIGTCVENLTAPHPILLRVEFDKQTFKYEEPSLQTSPVIEESQISPEEKQILEALLKKDGLSDPSPEELDILWKNRKKGIVVRDPKALPKFLKSVNWAQPEQVAEAHHLLKVTIVSNSNSLTLVFSKLKPYFPKSTQMNPYFSKSNPIFQT